MMVIEGDENDDALCPPARAVATDKGKSIARASSSGHMVAGRSTTTDTGVEVVCTNGRRVKLTGSIEYVWSHGEKYKAKDTPCQVLVPVISASRTISCIDLTFEPFVAVSCF